MERLDVLGFYFKKFETLNSKVINALINQEAREITNERFHGNNQNDILKLKSFLRNTENFNTHEIEALIAIFVK
jgi:hypothetical protein